MLGQHKGIKCKFNAEVGHRQVQRSLAVSKMAERWRRRRLLLQGGTFATRDSAMLDLLYPGFLIQENVCCTVISEKSEIALGVCIPLN